MSGNVLLINPWIQDFAAYDLWMKPLGLLYIGAALEASGYSVSLLDCLDKYNPDLLRLQCRSEPKLAKYGCGNFYSEEIAKPDVYSSIPRKYKRYGITPEIFRKELDAQQRPDLIVVTSMMTYWYPGVFEAIAIAKEKFPSVPVALGGVYATLCYDHAVQNSGADYVFRGTGENVILNLLEDTSGGIVQSADRDLRQSFGIKLGEPSPMRDNSPRRLDSLRPAYHLMRKIDSASVITSIGCPFRCTYCASKILQPSLYQRNPSKVADEIEYIARKFKVRDIAFYDDALLLNARDHIIPILDSICGRRLPLRFHTPNGLHAQLIDDVLAHKLIEANFVTLRLSFETSNPERQRDSQNKITNEGLAEAILHLRRAGFNTKNIEVYVMTSIPGQSVEEVVDSLVYVHSVGGRVKIAQYSPIPKTPDFTKAQEGGWVSELEPLTHNNVASPLWAEDLSFDACCQVNSLAAVLNSALDKGINIADSSRLAKGVWRALKHLESRTAN